MVHAVLGLEPLPVDREQPLARGKSRLLQHGHRLVAGVLCQAAVELLEACPAEGEPM